MTCPHLSYQQDGDGKQFDHERPYCEVAEQFVQSMRADICANRYDLVHDQHCEIYREHHGIDGYGAEDHGTEDE